MEPSALKICKVVGDFECGVNGSVCNYVEKKGGGYMCKPSTSGLLLNFPCSHVYDLSGTL